MIEPYLYQYLFVNSWSLLHPATLVEPGPSLVQTCCVFWNGWCRVVVKLHTAGIEFLSSTAPLFFPDRRPKQQWLLGVRFVMINAGGCLIIRHLWSTYCDTTRLWKCCPAVYSSFHNLWACRMVAFFVASQKQVSVMLLTVCKPVDVSDTVSEPPDLGMLPVVSVSLHWLRFSLSFFPSSVGCWVKESPYWSLAGIWKRVHAAASPGWFIFESSPSGQSSHCCSLCWEMLFQAAPD